MRLSDVQVRFAYPLTFVLSRDACVIDRKAETDPRRGIGCRLLQHPQDEISKCVEGKRNRPLNGEDRDPLDGQFDRFLIAENTQPTTLC